MQDHIVQIILLLWLALQLPLGSYIGDCIRFGITELP